MEVLAEDYWELEDGGGSPGKADDGTQYLIRVDDKYQVLHPSGGETTDEGRIETSTTAEAVEVFRRLWGSKQASGQ